MKKGYYWIPQTDFTWNAMQFYESRIVGDITFDMRGGKAYFSLSLYFPVGSVFHFIGGKENYVITEREKKPGLRYVAERADGCPLTKTDIIWFTSGHSIRRDGFMHEGKKC